MMDRNAARDQLVRPILSDKFFTLPLSDIRGVENEEHEALGGFGRRNLTWRITEHLDVITYSWQSLFL